MGEGRYNENLGSPDKGKERDLSNYCHRQNRLSGEINCICCQTPSSDLSLLLGLYFQIPYILLAQQHVRTGTGVAVSSSHLVSAPPFSSAGLLTLFPCSSMRSLPWETVFYKLLQHESLPQAAILRKLLQHGFLSSGTGCFNVVPPQDHKSCQELTAV